MTTPQFGSPEWARNLEKAVAEMGKGFARVGYVLAAQGAMGWAYRGDLDQARNALKSMSPDQLQELSAAASMLAGLADEELAGR
jgi:hypothetical protein